MILPWPGLSTGSGADARRDGGLWCNGGVSAADLALYGVLLVVYLPHAVLLAWADGREHRLPNPLVASLTLSLTVCLGLLALLVPSVRQDLKVAAVLALLLGVGAILIALVAPPLLGMGDAKTLPAVVAMTAAFGGQQLIAGVLGIMLLAGLAGTVVLVATRRAGVRFAVGPVLLAGPFLGLLGAPLVDAALGTA